MRASHPPTIEEGNATPLFAVSMEDTENSSPELVVVPSFGESTQVPSTERGNPPAIPSHAFLPLVHQPSGTTSGYNQSTVSSINSDNRHTSATFYSQNGVSVGQYDDHARWIAPLGSLTQHPTLPHQKSINNDQQVDPAVYANKGSPLQSTSGWPIRAPPLLPPPDRRHPLPPESSYVFRH